MSTKNISIVLTRTLQNTPVLQRLARGSFWIFISTLLTRALSFCSTVLIARVLGKDQYGEIGIYTSTMELMGMVTGFGLGTTVTKYIAEYKKRDPQKAGNIISFVLLTVFVLGTIVTCAVFISAPWIATTLLKRESVASLLRAGSISILLSSLSGVLSESLVGFEAFRKTAILNFWQGLTVPVILISTVFFFGVYSVIIASIASGVIGVTLGLMLLRRECRLFAIEPKFTASMFSEWKIIPSFSFPAMLTSIFFLPLMWAANLLLVNQPNGYAELGRYNVANQWRMLFIVLQNILTPVMFPILTDVYGNESRAAFKNASMLNVKLTWFLSLPISAFIVLFRHPIAALYGAEFHDVDLIIAVLAVVSFFNMLTATAGVVIVSAGKMWWGTILNLVWGMILLGTASLTVPRFGALGLAMAFAVSYLIHTINIFTIFETVLLPKAISKEIFLVFLTLLIAVLEISTAVYQWHYSIGLLILCASFYPLVKIVRHQLKVSAST